ncbi:YeeE/YedE family protein [Sulfitobacter aestuariivivens]|uniref:YeeE/YedE family protein n=1 Tax=Sulfitobacter aestuariivivens TaxID=2766981 RepID=A0A927HE15_9RHOB|nr:YeeE/YedE thiosulfate transporter family protein [Sulfitobacter aestuariivivens]MBD3662903.1 YeeE/YedE family protein [Sulfitobacter aestuariivivens]
MEMDWIWGLLGGLMIGGAGALYLLGNGRIMGVSGIAGGLIDGSSRSARAEGLAFLAGLIALPALLHLSGAIPVATHITSNIALIIAGGLLVGLGTRIGNGCTSGHGVCGISRLSPRGIVATLIYIAAGAVVVVALRSLVGGL